MYSSPYVDVFRMDPRAPEDPGREDPGVLYRNTVSFSEVSGTIIQIGVLYGNLVRGGRKKVSALYEKSPESIASTFVTGDSEGFSRLCRELLSQQHRCAVVVGASGSGRTSAAVTALFKAGYQVRPLLVGQEEEEDPFADIDCEKGHGYLVDVSDAGALTPGFADHLRGFAAAVSRNGSALVVVAEPKQYRSDLIPGAPHHYLQKPPGKDVLHSHLVWHTKEEVTARLWSEDPRVLAMIQGAAPPEIAQLARLIGETVTPSDPSPDTHLNEVRERYLKWGPEVADWFGENSGPEGVWNRVVKTALTLLEGRTARRVLDGARDLAAALGIPPQDAGGIAGAGVGPTLDKVEAFRESNGTVFFRKPGYADAVLDHLWGNHDSVRTALLGWAFRQAVLNGGELAEFIASRLFSLFERQQEPDEVVRFFESWSRLPDLRVSAAAVAAAAAVHPRFGQRMRRRLYELARNPPSPEVAIAVAQACTAYAGSERKSALIRLKWLSGSLHGSVREEVLAGLCTLTRGTAECLALAEHVLVWDAEDTEGLRKEVTFRFFSHILEFAEHGVPGLLGRHVEYEYEHESRTMAEIWYVLLDRAPADLLLDPLSLWVEAALHDEGCHEGLSFLLGSAVLGSDESEDAVARRTVRAGRLIDQACQRSGIDPEQPAVHHLHMGLRSVGDRREPVADR